MVIGLIEFVCGRAGSGKSVYIAEKIRQSLSNIKDPLGRDAQKKLYLIVPEQQAVVWESRAARMLPPSASLSLEIISFTRLSNLAARTYGGLSDSYITRGGKAALMWSTLRSLADALQIYGSSVRPERVTPMLLSAVSEMKRNGVTPAALDEAAEQLAREEDSLPLARRVRELALISASYQHLLTERYTDDEDELMHLAERLKTEPFFTGADVFVDSFFSLTPVENEIMHHIFRQAENVTVSFACPKEDSGEAQFASPRSFFSAMRRAADRANRPYTVTALTENRRSEALPLRQLEAGLWRFDAPASDEVPGDAIRMIQVRDRYAEAQAAVCRIHSLVHSGARCADIALIARDAKKLRGILDTELEKAGIPCFFSENSDVSARPASRLLFAALSAVGGGWRREDILLCAKTGLCSLTDDECDALEIYTETWHIRSQRAFESPWNMNPDGYVPTMSARAEKMLETVNTAREKLIPPLVRFSSVFTGGTAAVPEICRASYELLCEFGVWDALRDSAAALGAAGRRREMAEESQLWDVLMDALDTLAEVLPDARTDAAAFSALLRQVLSAAHIGSIPSGTDEVVIGSADQVRLDEIRHVILLGAADGEFPGVPSEDGFFSDTDKIRLEGEGITLSATSADRMKEELLWFYRAAALPRCSLTVLIPQSDNGTPLSPSLAAERIKTLFPALKTEDFAAWDEAERIWTPADARRDTLRLRRTPAGDALEQLDALPSPEISPIPLSGKNESVSPETAAMLFPKNLSLTQSRLDSFVLCRFGYYCRYVMKLEEKKEASLSAVNVGSFLHRVLELFFAHAKEEVLPLPEERLTALTDTVVSEVVREITPPDVRRGRTDYLFTRLKRCVLPLLRALEAEFAQSQFRPVRFELPIGTADPDALPALSVPTGDGHTVRLRGVIDRLDTWRDGDDTYVRVVDYKTGSKKFAQEDIAVGVNMQLLLYLFSVLNCPPGEFRHALSGKPDGPLKAAGALYFSARPGESTADVLLPREQAERLVRDNIDRSGILLAEEPVLRAMDASLSGEFIPVKAKKEGFSGKAALSAEEISALETEMRASIARIGREMCSGAAEARPRKLHGQNPCDWCSMKNLCRSAAQGQEEHETANSASEGKEET